MLNLPTFSAGQPIKASDFMQLVAAIRELQDASGVVVAAPSDGAEPQKDIFDPVFDAEIDGVNAGGDRYSWHEVTNLGGTVDDFTAGRECDDPDDGSAAVEVNGWLFVPTETRVRMVEIRDGDTFRYEFVFPVPPPDDQTGATDYVLTYDKDTQAVAWEEIEECDDSGTSDGTDTGFFA